MSMSASHILVRWWADIIAPSFGLYASFLLSFHASVSNAFHPNHSLHVNLTYINYYLKCIHHRECRVMLPARDLWPLSKVLNNSQCLDHPWCLPAPLQEPCLRGTRWWAITISARSPPLLGLHGRISPAGSHPSSCSHRVSRLVHSKLPFLSVTGARKQAKERKIRHSGHLQLGSNI